MGVFKRQATAAEVGSSLCYVTRGETAFVSQRHHPEADAEVIAALAAITLAIELGGAVADSPKGSAAFRRMLAVLVEAGDAATANAVFNSGGVRPNTESMPKGTVAWASGKLWVKPGAEGLLVGTWRESEGYNPAEHGFRILSALWHLADQTGSGRVVLHAFRVLSDLEGVRMDDLRVREGLPSTLLDYGQEGQATDDAVSLGEALLFPQAEDKWSIRLDGREAQVAISDSALAFTSNGQTDEFGNEDLGALWRPGPGEVLIFSRRAAPLGFTFESPLDCQDFCDAMRKNLGREIRAGVPTAQGGSELAGQPIDASGRVTPGPGPPPAGWYQAPDGSGEDQWWTGSAWGPKRA